MRPGTEYVRAPMLSTRFFPGLVLLTILAGCATQLSQGDDGLGNDVPAEPEDGGAPTFDVAVPDMDAGQSDDADDPDTGSEETDSGAPTADRGGNTPDVQVTRDSGFPTDRGTVNCFAQTNCTACTAFPSCGWCAATGRCVDGGETGPVGSVCAMGWAWTSSACTSVDPCAASTTCTTCAAQAGCGWCGASSRCVTANTATTGPAAGACASGWSGTAAACAAPPPDPCAGLTNCGSCTGDARCGWCRTGTGRCISGTRPGPNPVYGTCASWAYVLNECSNPADPCSTSRGCGSCTDRGSCGWCEDSETCHTGSSGGPTDRACRSSQWTWQNILGFCSPF